MPYVYLLRSEKHPAHTYVGLTQDVEKRRRWKSHDSATRKITVKKSSSRWADQPSPKGYGLARRPVPVLQVELPEPWSIIAAADIAAATGAKCAGNPGVPAEAPEGSEVWSSFLLNIRTWFEQQASS